MGIRVYRDQQANSVVFTPSTVDDSFLNSLHAVEGEDGLVYVYSIHNQNQMELAAVNPTDILNRDGNVVSADLATVINYLNSQFDASGAIPSPPVVVSPLAESVVEGKPLNYFIIATNDPIFYTASGLPAGLVVNSQTGNIFGATTAVGVHVIPISAVNNYGTDTENLTLTVLADVPGWEDTYSMRFQNSVFQQYLEIAAPTAAISQSSHEAWSVSFWTVVLDTSAHDFFSQGADATEARSVKTTGGAIRVFMPRGPKAIDLTAGTILPTTWYHIVVTNSGSGTAAGVKVYVNGALQVNSVTQDNLNGAVGDSDPFRMGRFSGSVSDADWLEGVLDEFSYWDKELSALEVTSIYNGGVPNDISSLGISNLAAWWRMGDAGDAYPLIYDKAGTNTATMRNMTVASITSYTPP